MEWSDELSLKLIECYRDKPMLWDPTNRHYKLTKKKVDIWRSIADEFKCDIPEVKRKMESLLSSYRRGMRRETTTHSGIGPDDLYHSKWFAFKAIQFLNDRFRPTVTQNTDNDRGDETQQNVESESNSSQEDEDGLEDENAQDNATEESQSSVRVETSKRKVFTSPKLPYKKRLQEDPRINAAFNVLQAFGEKRATRVEKDECVLYGEYVASQLAKFDERMRAIVKHQIGNILFEAEMGRTQHQALQPLNNWIGSSSPMASATSSPSATPSTSYARQYEQGTDELFYSNLYHQ